MRCAEFAPTGECPARTIAQALLHRPVRVPEPARRQAAVMVTWNEAKQVLRVAGQAPLRSSASGRSRARAGAPAVPVRLRAQRRGLQHRQAAPRCRTSASSPTRARATPRSRGSISASRPARSEACVSPYGVYDMTGNVDEWVVNESGRPYKSGLKGGYWGPVRDRCRPMTTPTTRTSRSTKSASAAAATPRRRHRAEAARRRAQRRGNLSYSAPASAGGGAGALCGRRIAVLHAHLALELIDDDLLVVPRHLRELDDHVDGPSPSLARTSSSEPCDTLLPLSDEWYSKSR